jgi:ABC-type branched-subunit amino acid transport system substrate-binding protein
MTTRRQFALAAASMLAAPAVLRAQGSNKIILGQSAAFTGPAAELGIQFHQGAKLWFDQINAQGGVGGKTVEIKTLDDGYEPDRCAANTQKLIAEDVHALFGYIGTPTSLAALPLLTKAQIPFIAPFTGAMGLREPFNRQVFHLRASYNDETALIVRQLTNLGLKKIAVFHQNDAYGKAGLDGVTLALGQQGLKPIATATVERNSVDVAQPSRPSMPQRPTPWCRSVPTSLAPPTSAPRARPATGAPSTTCPSSARRRWPMSWARTAPAWWSRRSCPRPTRPRARSRVNSPRR